MNKYYIHKSRNENYFIIIDDDTQSAKYGYIIDNKVDKLFDGYWTYFQIVYVMGIKNIQDGKVDIKEITEDEAFRLLL